MSFGFSPDDEQNPFMAFSQMFSGQQPNHDVWETAAQLAQQIANQESSGANVDPVARTQILELVRVAEVNLGQVVGIQAPPQLDVKVVTPAEWTTESLDVFRPFFERFGEAIKVTPEADSGGDPFAAMLSQVFSSLGPVMVATSAGSMLGHLAAHTLGQYDLPIPRPGNTILLVPENMDAIAKAASAPETEVYLTTLLHNAIMHAVFTIEHVRRRAEDLFIDYAAAFQANTDFMETDFESLDSIQQIQELAESFNSPDAVLSMMQSPAHDLLVPQITALIAPILGFVDYQLDQIAGPLVSSFDNIKTAIAEQQDQSSDSDHFMQKLLGINMSNNTVRLGREFIDGVIDRSGNDGLERLWDNELDLPTASEVAAPGLWLERIGYGSEDGSIFEVPDDISGIEDL